MPVNDNLRMPDFLLVGAQKSGTTSITNYLRQHPDISISRIKEPNFFSYYNESRFSINKLKEFNALSKNSFDVITNFEDYIKLFDSNKSIYGDCSVHYLYQYKMTIKNIKKYIKKDIHILK